VFRVEPRAAQADPALGYTARPILMSVGKRMVSNVFRIGVFKALADVSVLGMFIFLARHFGRDGLGEYAFAMAFTGFLALVANFGFEQYAVREVARVPEREGTYFGTFTLLSALLCPVLLGVLVLAAWLLGYDEARLALIAAIGSYQVLYFFSFVVLGRFKARNEMFRAGALEFALRIAILGGVVGLSLAGHPMSRVALVFPVATLAYLAAAAVLLARTHAPLVWRLDLEFVRRAWREVWPFGVTMVLHASYLKVDVLMLGFLRTETEVGVYSAAFRPIFGFLTLVAFCCHAVYPVFSRLFVESRETLRRALERMGNYLVVACGLIGVGVACLAEPVIHVLYGADYAESVPVFRLFAIHVLVGSVNTLLSPFLGAINRERDRMKGLVASLVVNVVANFFLVTYFGYVGALVATILAETVFCFLMYTRVRSEGLGVRLGPKLARALLAGGTAFGLWAWCADTGFGWVGIAAAPVAYLVLVAATGGIQRRDLASMRQWFGGPGAVPDTTE